MTRVTGARRHDRPAWRGQSLVELALVLPIFLFLLFGLIDAGRLVFANSTVSQAAREAARLATVQAPFIGATGSDCTAPVCPADDAEFRANVVAAANEMTSIVGVIPTGSVSIFCTAGDPPTGWTSNDCAADNDPFIGNTVSVRIDIPIEPLLPFFDWFYPDNITATATMLI
ncbi:MAG: pilus assembly protein [Gemmatimonadaceae bacterium]|nr:pilus assembly protein [Gemmatimonadaceae bacterium]